MPKPIEDPFLIVYQNSVMLLSLCVGVILLALRLRGPLLRFQPRKLVPWNAIGSALAVLMVTIAILSAVGSQSEHDQDAKEGRKHAAAAADDAAQEVFRITSLIVEQIAIVGGTLFLVSIYFNATCEDLGLPANIQQLGKDTILGVVAVLGAIGPVFIIMSVLAGPEMKSGHPLVKMLSESEPNLPVFILTSFAAVIVAPICEEFIFRLLLQGWLEKCEATLRGIVRENEARDALALSDMSPSTAQAPADVDIYPAESRTIIDSTSASDVPPLNLLRTVVDTSHGWVAIVISATFFGIAHYGYGPEPIPLFFLALMLGYLYNRTHRVVPGMVAHALFNMYTMIALWRMVFYDHIKMQ